MEAVCFCLANLPPHGCMQTFLKIGFDLECKMTWRMSRKWWRWIGAESGWTRQRSSRCVMAGKTVAVTDWEGVTAAHLCLNLSLEDRNKTHPSVLYGWWFSPTNSFKGEVKYCLKRRRICLKKHKVKWVKIHQLKPSVIPYEAFNAAGSPGFKT